MSTIPLRPLDFGEILDTAFGLFRRDYRLYMPLSLVGLVPASVATAIPTSADTEPEVLLSDLGSGLLFFGLLAVGLLFSLMAWAALVTAMEARIGGRRASIGSSYARALALLPKLTGATCLALLALVAAVLVVTIPTSFLTAMAVRDRSLLGAAVIAIVIGVTMVVVMAWWATHTYMLVPAIVIEERGPIRALGEFKRSSQHLREELRWRHADADERIELYVHRCVHQAVRRWDAASIGRGSGQRSLEVCRARRPPWQRVCPPLSGRAGFANVVAWHPSSFVPSRGAISRSLSEKRSPFFEPVVVACARSPGSWAAHPRRSRENCGETQLHGEATSSIGPRPLNGTPIGERNVQSLRSSLRTPN